MADRLLARRPQHALPDRLEVGLTDGVVLLREARGR